MENKMPDDVPYIVFEGVMARNERMLKRLVIAVVITVILLVASNCLWLYAWMQYDYCDDTITVDSGGGGNANYIGEDGDIINGKDSSQEADKTKEERTIQGSEEKD